MYLLLLQLVKILNMKKINFILLIALILSWSFQSCNNTESYADLKKNEQAGIKDFISDNNIKVISFEDFLAQDSTTDVSKNEFVLFKETGVYMQIVRKGVGMKLENGDRAEVLARYLEVNLNDVDTISSNVYGSYVTNPDKFTVVNTNGILTASFDTNALMYNTYGSQSVPSGWLVPFPYIRLGRWGSEDGVAKIRLIVPHDEGQSHASSSIYACYYELTYELGK